MKRLTATALIIFTLAAALTGCKGTPARSGQTGRLSVVATVFAAYDFAREIAGDLADVLLLLPSGSDSHTYEPTAQDGIKIANSDLFIYTGGESDTWIDSLLTSAGAGRTITLMDCADPVGEELVEGMEADEEEEDALDEHVWTSPQNAKRIVSKIADELCKADEANEETYRLNAEKYLGQLDELDAAFRDAVDGAVRKTIIFGDRFPFRYLADAYGLEYYAAFPGCSSETEASAATVAFLIEKVSSGNIPVVFYTETSDRRMAEIISEASGAKTALLHSCHNLSREDFQNGETYISLMKKNAEALREALR